MRDHEMKEAAEARASQEDPIVMYLIVHESLNMSTGKTAAQAAHASSMLMIEYFEMKDKSRNLQKQMDFRDPDKAEALQAEYKELARSISIYGEWMKSSFRKVVLRASDKEWEKIKTELKDLILIVRDAGLTEVEPGSETVIGVWPMRKSQRPKTLTRLQVLK